MKRWTMVAGCVVAGMCLTACGALHLSSSSPPPESAWTPASAHRSLASVPDATAQSAPTWQATGQQYANVTVANSQLLVSSLVQLQNADMCTWIRPGAPDLQPGLICTSAVTSVRRTSSSLATALLESQQPRNAAYIGSPPGQVSELVDQTVAAATRLHRAGVGAESCVVGQGLGCLGKLSSFASAMSRMNVDLVAWSPYI